MILPSLALFIASLWMPALEFVAHAPVSGVVVLCWGWFGVLSGNFPWFANPLYFMALYFAWQGRRPAGLVCSGLALGFGLLSLRVHEWWFNEGWSTPVQSLGPAFDFWMAGFLLLFVLLFFSRKPENSLPDHVDAPKT